MLKQKTNTCLETIYILFSILFIVIEFCDCEYKWVTNSTSNRNCLSRYFTIRIKFGFNLI